jgi:hypothetical protein
MRDIYRQRRPVSIQAAILMKGVGHGHQIGGEENLGVLGGSTNT